jgi:DDE superfamily endonuclease
MNSKNWIGDKGYIGNNMITPYRKPAGGELLDWQKEYNEEVNKIRWMIEQAISHFKNWTIMHTRDSSKSWGVFSLAGGRLAGVAGGDFGRCGASPR